MLPDQIKVWDRKHGKGDHEKLRTIVSPLAELALPYLPEHSKILELGCGVGRDAIFFASHGHTVIATDGSETVITQNKKQSHQNVEFGVLDMRNPLLYSSEEFDAVFANLSLHYYENDVTHQVVGEAARVLKPGGLFIFACKSRDDYRTKDAREVERDIFVDKNNHAVHLFSLGYARQLAQDVFKIELLEEIEEEYDGRASNIVRCIAKKSKE